MQNHKPLGMIGWGICLCLLAALAGCAQPTIPAAGQEPDQPAAAITDQQTEGSSFEKAVVIQEKTEIAGVPAEYTWLRDHYPSYKRISQSMISHDGKSYDILHIETEDRQEIDIYFDISSFFGHF
ncbi:MAG: hypothetical protein LBH31_01165 [Burkholderiaceae bacterium]|jgi:hypothetical protein|nr:hypothetical protein [Burkholderiaceae bacterium]